MREFEVENFLFLGGWRTEYKNNGPYSVHFRIKAIVLGTLEVRYRFIARSCHEDGLRGFLWKLIEDGSIGQHSRIQEVGICLSPDPKAKEGKPASITLHPYSTFWSLH